MLPSPVLVERQRVHHQGVPEQVHLLAGVAHAVGPAQVERVLQASVDGLGVAAPAVDFLEVGVAWRDGPDILGPVELPGGVLVVAVQADDQVLVTVKLRQDISSYQRKAPDASWFRSVRSRGSSTKLSSPLSVNSPRPMAPPRA